MRWTGLLAIVATACSPERSPGVPEPAIAPAISAPRRDAAAVVTPVRLADASVGIDAPGLPATLDDALAELRTRGFIAASEVIARRAAQREPKMRLSAEQAHAAALAVLAVVDRPAFVELHGVMPRSTVELARAVRERGLALDEAETIAGYLVRVVATLAFARLAVFDENHSHVTGRDWQEIDYTGEGMTWQSQRADWQPRGVKSFRDATSIHAYFVGASRLPHWQRVYRPRGRIEDVAPP